MSTHGSMKRVIRLMIGLLAFALLATACGGDDESGATTAGTSAGEETTAAGGGLDEPIKVGSKEFTEQLLLGEMTIDVLESHGYETEDMTEIGGTAIVRQALEEGEIDVYWEYTGTAWFTHFGESEALDPAEMETKVREMDAANGITWLDPAGFNNTYTLMIQQADEGTIGSTLSDLASYVDANPDTVVCINEEFAVRPDGLPALTEAYNFNFQDVEQMTTGLTYAALAEGDCDVAMGFATDGRIARLGLMNLEDDQGFFPAYFPAANVRTEILDAAPDVADYLNCLAASLSTETMTELNARVDSDGESVADVATSHLAGTDCLGDM
jgi:osmoprotectant transport system substrate-binding protein